MYADPLHCHVWVAVADALDIARHAARSLHATLRHAYYITRTHAWIHAPAIRVGRCGTTTFTATSGPSTDAPYEIDQQLASSTDR
jgi:hypothetical protein